MDRQYTFREYSLKFIHVMQALLLQKPNKYLKANNHVTTLERRLELWGNGNIIELLNESELIKEKLPTDERSENFTKIFVNFKELMQRFSRCTFKWTCKIDSSHRFWFNRWGNVADSSIYHRGLSKLYYS